MKLVLASSNAGKLAELHELLGEGFDLHVQSEFGVADADETGLSFIENAILKARHAARRSGLPALGDDSGLCVDALGGAPGVYSTHYAALEPALDADREALRTRQDAANNAKLLAALDGVSTRRARFVCALVAVRSAHDPEPLIAFGRWNGEILAAPEGSGGFGYDPLMFIPAQGCAAAAMPADTKNRLSHRAIACAQMLALMREVWQRG